ncbi:hypothetical protein NQ314_015066 [Rhamnusium bicolor]|uniref:START domain-containing protein n=1 Tax=Rhamnusium bicolor TaxID=1586634 RepID=A0AAV8WZQ1_9CUCU|nr:hypothetical protein NQ314_015066 [Rhamnusium bicolor]
MFRQKFNDLKNIKEVNRKLKDFIKNGKFYNMIVRCPESRVVPTMYLRYGLTTANWWEELALKEFIRKMRQTISKKGKEFALGAIGISAYNWDENRIPDDSMREHIHELEYIYELKENTLCLKYYRRKWDTTAVSLEVAETDSTPNSNSDIIYWEMLWPKNIVIEDYWSCMVIKPYTELDKPGIEFSLTYFDNPGVNIPSSVTTWVSMRAMPDFLERLRAATKKYKDYCKKEGVSEACKILIEEEKAKEELSQKDKLEYCTFKPKENVKLKAPHPKQDIENKKTKPSDRHGLNSGNFTRNIDINPSDINSTPPSAAVQSENSNFWKYLHPLYYFH